LSTHVLHVIARMNIGGTARYVGELVEKIPNNKLATGYVQGSEVEDSCVNRLALVRVPHMGRKISPLNDFFAWLELRKIIADVRPQIIHTHTFKAGLIGRLLRGNHKRIHTFHGHLLGDQSFSFFQKEIITFAEKLLARRTNLLISVGKKVGIELRAEGIGVDRDWLSIPPGVEPLPVVSRDQARKTLGLANDGILIGWMARMTEVKNPFLFLEIAKILDQFNFVMAGGGNLLEDIRREAPENVKVLGWADAAIFWSAVDCAVSTSDNEGMPIALIEAQLAGVPVIATDVGSNSEVVNDGVTGIVSSSDANEIAESIKKVVTDVSLLQSMGQASKVWATEQYGLTKMIDAHLQAYGNLIR